MSESDERSALYAMPAPTQLTEQDLTQLLTQYRLTETETYVSHSHLNGGLSNSNYRFDTSLRSLLVKGCDNKSIDELDTQIRALISLKHTPNSPPIAYPVRKTNLINQSVNSFQSSDYVYQSQSPDAKPIVVYDFLNGRPPMKATDSVMKQLARALATLHRVSPQEYSYLPQFPMGLVEIEPFLNVEVPTLASEVQNHTFIDFLRNHVDSLKPLLESESLKSNQSILHGDLFLENVVFSCDADPQLLGLIDFEEMCIGHTALDVAMTIVGCCYNTRDELDWELTKVFLTEYQHVSQLTQEEQQAFPSFLLYACLSIGFWRFRQFVVRTPDEMRKDSYMSMVRRIERIDEDGIRAMFF